MKEVHAQKMTVSKTVYEEPQLKLILLSDVDIVTASGDENQGEWDPQNVN